MAKHWSVRQFQKMCNQLPKVMVKNMNKHLDEIANNTAVAVAVRAPRGEDGRNELRESVRYHEGRHPLSMVIRAGGPLTTVNTGGSGGFGSFWRGVTGKLEYDYSLGIEFGTQYMPAQSFFFPTIRERRQRDQRKMRKHLVDDLRYWGFK